MLFRKYNTLSGGKILNGFIWDLLLFSRRTFLASEDISIPADKVLQMHSPVFDGELLVDGEAYIL